MWLILILQMRFTKGTRRPSVLFFSLRPKVNITRKFKQNNQVDLVPKFGFDWEMSWKKEEVISHLQVYVKQRVWNVIYFIAFVKLMYFKSGLLCMNLSLKLKTLKSSKYNAFDGVQKLQLFWMLNRQCEGRCS